jgi:hypothetical protein
VWALADSPEIEGWVLHSADESTEAYEFYRILSNADAASPHS